MAGEKCIMLDADYVDACNAVREKGGSTSPAIKSSELGPAIRAIPAGGPAPVIKPLEITENGEYTAPPGVDGYSPVSVNVPSGGGGDTANEDGLLTHTGTSYINNRVTQITSLAFQSWTSLKTITMKNLERLKIGRCFYECGVETVDFPALNSGFYNDFQNCKSLKSVVLPSCMVTPGFPNCTSLETVDIGGNPSGNIRKVDQRAFQDCGKLSTLIIRDMSKIYTLVNVNAFIGTPIVSGTGYVYVPKALIDQYKAETNWVELASQIRAIEDYPEITGG